MGPHFSLACLKLPPCPESLGQTIKAECLPVVLSFSWDHRGLPLPHIRRMIRANIESYLLSDFCASYLMHTVNYEEGSMIIVSLL